MSNDVFTLAEAIADRSKRDAGDGMDIVVVTGKRETVKYVKLNNGFDFRQEDNTYVGIYNTERIQFSDGVLAFDLEGAAGQAYRLYQAAFGRTPDNYGLKYWIGEFDAGMSLEEAAARFIDSNEFRAGYEGGIVHPHILVESLYQTVLGRNGEPEGVAYWVDEITSGDRSLARVLVEFSESPENFDRVAPSVIDGIWFY